MSKKHRDNLAKLATYLESLPVTYASFDMWAYMAPKNRLGYRIQVNHKRKVDCGTVACAVGHGPSAGIRTYDDWSWNAYAWRVFGIERGNPHEVWAYLFSSEWHHYDNTAHGAAARIRTFLESGVPRNWESQRASKARGARL